MKNASTLSSFLVNANKGLDHLGAYWHFRVYHLGKLILGKIALILVTVPGRINHYRMIKSCWKRPDGTGGVSCATQFPFPQAFDL